tara:strand:+ start:705 stop:1766 length:1062 start_codon:yes stop_codon:yes gene_type:complete
MLNDTFLRRYERTPLRESFEERDRRLIIQSFQILSTDLRPLYVDGKKSEEGSTFWAMLHDQVARELGLRELSPKYYSYKTTWAGKETTQSGAYDMVKVCESWMSAMPTLDADRHIKERLSLVELGFRIHGNDLQAAARVYQNILNQSKPSTPPPSLSTMRPENRVNTSSGNWFDKKQKDDEAHFRRCVEELNERFRQAGYTLDYHNGFIQISAEDIVQREVEAPFWRLISDQKWANVDLDMKEALDRRDTSGRDPAWYAARALESAIKIISSEKGWTKGSEKGAHNYIDNLSSKKNGFITGWEASILKEYFTSVRNPFGHGPGTEDMPSLSTPQTQWALEFAMSWIKSLVMRM